MKIRYRYRIRETGAFWVVERRHPLWFWHYLSGKSPAWYSGGEYWAPSPNQYSSAALAEDALKAAIIQTGINRAHHSRVKHIPPWSST
jgi:hypothetical protein